MFLLAVNIAAPCRSGRLPRACDHPAIPAKGKSLFTKESPVTRKRLSTISIWLGLFAMLMIHVGPLFSAFQLSEASAASVEHAEHAEHAQPRSAHGHHQQGSTGEPAWLAALDLCGYCELLTVNPPLALSVDLVLPRHEPDHFQPLPEQPLTSAPRRSSGYPRAPPHFHS